jgi:regulator of protease activity HflC (stomatin/prohibitin superfamily)
MPNWDYPRSRGTGGSDEPYSSGLTPGRLVAYVAIGFAALILIVVFFAFMGSFKGVDAGHIAFVKEGGPFDGRNIKKDVRQPGSGLASIGIFNSQIELPTTERDLTSEIGPITVPSRDGVDMVIRGQVPFRLTTDPVRAREFLLKYGLRKWDGHDLTSDDGWAAFLQTRVVPIYQEAVRDGIGQFDCIELKNTCVYVLEGDKLADTKAAAEVQAKAKDANTSQNIAAAQERITGLLQLKLKQGLGGEYFEGVRFQNLNPSFRPAIQDQVTASQAKRAENAEAQLEAQRVKTVAEGQAQRQIAESKGQRDSDYQRAKGIRALAKAYRSNPAQVQIDKIKAYCGGDGCDPQVVGTGNIIPNLGGR